MMGHIAVTKARGYASTTYSECIRQMVKCDRTVFVWSSDGPLRPLAVMTSIGNALRGMMT